VGTAQSRAARACSRDGREIRQLGQQVFVNTLIMALWLNADRLLGLGDGLANVAAAPG
jgi:hypothetical protein